MSKDKLLPAASFMSDHDLIAQLFKDNFKKQKDELTQDLVEALAQVNLEHQAEVDRRLEGIKIDVKGIQADMVILKKRNSNRAIAKRVIIAVAVALIIGALALFVFFPWIHGNLADSVEMKIMSKKTFDTLEAQRERGFAGTTRSIPMGSVIENDSLLTKK